MSHHYMHLRHFRQGSVARNLTYDIFYEDEDVRVHIPARHKDKQLAAFVFDDVWAVGGTGWKSHHRARHQWEAGVRRREKRARAARRRAMKRGEMPAE